jgi:hypothetical protein
MGLFAANDNGQYQTTPLLLSGQEHVPQARLAVSKAGQKIFDFTTYGSPAPDAITPDSHFDVTYTIFPGYTFGFSNMLHGADWLNDPCIVDQNSNRTEFFRDGCVYVSYLFAINTIIKYNLLADLWPEADLTFDGLIRATGCQYIWTYQGRFEKE